MSPKKLKNCLLLKKLRLFFGGTADILILSDKKKEKIMAIGMAQQQGNMVYVYDENNYHLWSRTGEMLGYTSNTVTIKQGNMLYMYNEKNTNRIN